MNRMLAGSCRKDTSSRLLALDHRGDKKCSAQLSQAELRLCVFWVHLRVTCGLTLPVQSPTSQNGRDTPV